MGGESDGQRGEKVRRNGCSRPLSPYQILFNMFFLVVPLYANIAHTLCLKDPYGKVFFGIFEFIHLSSFILAIHLMLFDPRQEKAGWNLDRSSLTCMCNICKIKVHPSTKHCMVCNKCVYAYDHHCCWLNNCVSQKNIVLFRVYLWALIIALAGIFSTSVSTLVLSVLKYDSFGMSCPSWSRLFQLISSPICIVLSFGVGIPIIQMIVLHMRMAYWKVTTLEYIHMKEAGIKPKRRKTSKKKDTLPYSSRIGNMQENGMENKRQNNGGYVLNTVQFNKTKNEEINNINNNNNGNGNEKDNKKPQKRDPGIRRYPCLPKGCARCLVKASSKNACGKNNNNNNKNNNNKNKNKDNNEHAKTIRGKIYHKLKYMEKQMDKTVSVQQGMNQKKS